MVAWAGTLPLQTWQAGQVIVPVAFPALTAVSGSLVYSASSVPSGVIVDFTARTIYGIPDDEGDGTFTITVADDNTQADLEVNYEIAERRVPIVVPPIPDLVLHLGADIDYLFPEPEGGSGSYTTSLEYRPIPPFEAYRIHNTFLPEGLAYNAATRRLTGTLADSLANRGQSIGQVTLTNAQVWGSGNQFTGHNPPGSSLSGLTFQYPPFATSTTHYRWATIFTYGGGGPNRGQLGGLRVGIDPDIEDPPPIPNSPSVFIIDPDTNRVLKWFPVSLGSEQRNEANAIDLIWSRQPATEFRFEAGRNYYIEIATSSRSTFNYVVTDNTTGQVVKVPFVVLLIAAATGAPTSPVLESSTAGITTATVTLAAASLPDVSRIVAGPMPAGFPIILTDLRNYAYADDATNEVFFTGLDPATDYDIYLYYEDNQGRRSSPLVVEVRTEPARPAIPPLPVRGLQAEPGPNRLRLTWDDLPPFQRITKLRHRIDGGIWSDMPNVGGASTGYVVPGLIDGQQVTIEVQVVNPDGTSPTTSVTATPGTGIPPPFRTPIQSRILIDFDGLFLPVENRVLSATGETGRQPGTFDLAPGWAEIVLLASDGFIRLTSPAEHQGFYSAEDLRNRRCLIQELYEDATGRAVPVTRFGGWIEAAPMMSEGDEQLITLSVVDRLGQYARRLVRFTSSLPREYADERAKRILSQAGIPDDEVKVSANPVWCASRTASLDSPYEGNLLALLSQVANSTGGRLIVVEDQQKDGLPEVGQLCLEPARPIRPASATLSDNPDNDYAANPAWLPIAEIGNQPPAVLDPTNIYNQVEIRIPDGQQVIASDPESIATWGGRLYPLSDVIVERDEAEALARHILRVYANPRLLDDKVSCYLHFQEQEAALAVARLTLADTVRLSYLPAGTENRVEVVQQIDHIRWQHLPGDKQYCQVILEVGMLSPETSSYWIASHPGSNLLGEETWLAPLSSDRLTTGGYNFVYDPDNLEAAYVTADRYGLLARQTCPTYASEQERDEYEVNPRDGQPCLIAGDKGEGQTNRFYFHFDFYSSADNQWVTRAALSDTDANPVLDTLTWDTERYDDGKTWAA